MNARDVLLRAADLLDRERAWMQARVACDADGQEIHAYDPAAVRWNAVGAIARVAGPTASGSRLANEARCLLCRAVVAPDERGKCYYDPLLASEVIMRWNDTRGRTRKEVVDTLRCVAGKAARPPA